MNGRCGCSFAGFFCSKNFEYEACLPIWRASCLQGASGANCILPSTPCMPTKLLLLHFLGARACIACLCGETLINLCFSWHMQHDCSCCDRSDAITVLSSMATAYDDPDFSAECAEVTTTMLCRPCDPEVSHSNSRRCATVLIRWLEHGVHVGARLQQPCVMARPALPC